MYRSFPDDTRVETIADYAITSTYVLGLIDRKARDYYNFGIDLSKSSQVATFLLILTPDELDELMNHIKKDKINLIKDIDEA
jgi:hypothetical protein